ncbi:hypothetical protein BED65_15500 [Listeria monocytogenes]|nr:hypothetical protein [Listeria monocytogenes]
MKTYCAVGFQNTKSNGELAFPGQGSHELASQKEVKHLEIENKKLKEELEILKRVQVFLKQSQG